MMEFNNICSLVEKRQLAQCDDRHAAMIGDEFRCEIARRLPYRLTEKQLDFNDHNKIFSACWLSEDLVVAGTKCCKVSRAPVQFETQLWVSIAGRGESNNYYSRLRPISLPTDSY